MNPLLVLQARAEARALLFRCGDCEDLGDALTPLLVFAHEQHIDGQIGADGVWAIIQTAFGDDWVVEEC
jgi:hypothetical protein